jgi:hypothetical protein
VILDPIDADTGPPFFVGAAYGKARRPFTYDIFLSSSSEVKDLRDEVEELAMRSFSPALGLYANAGLNVVRWEQAQSGQVEGESVNGVFVRVVSECHHTLVLLMTHLGEGTREEVQEAIERDLPISIVRFEPWPDYESGFDPAEIDAFMKGFNDRGKPVLYRPCGPPGSPSAVRALSQTFAEITLGAYTSFLRETRDPLVEERG